MWIKNQFGHIVNAERVTAIDCVNEEIVCWKVRAWDASESPCILWRSDTESEAEGKIGKIWDALKKGENFLDLTK